MPEDCRLKERFLNKMEILRDKMKIEIIEEKKNKITFELPEMTHTFCNMLKTELWNDEHVKVATYTIRHPLIGKPKFIVETDGADPKKTLIAAGQRLQKQVSKFEELIEKVK